VKLLPTYVILIACALPFAASAQAVSDTAAIETSTRSTFAPGTVVTPEGRTIQLYLPHAINGFEKLISFCETHPEVRPYPKTKYISVDKIHCMSVRGQYFETLHSDDGKSLRILAPRLVEGPVELFNFAEGKSIPTIIPVAAIASAAAASTVLYLGVSYTSNHWYLRRNGKLMEVKRSKFTEQLATYLQDAPDLAQKVQTRAQGYQYQDMPQIITEYNLLLSAR